MDTIEAVKSYLRAIIYQDFEKQEEEIDHVSYDIPLTLARLKS